AHVQEARDAVGHRRPLPFDRSRRGDGDALKRQSTAVGHGDRQRRRRCRTRALLLLLRVGGVGREKEGENDEDHATHTLHLITAWKVSQALDPQMMSFGPRCRTRFPARLTRLSGRRRVPRMRTWGLLLLAWLTVA